jgi:hypothetical protein
MCGSSTCLVCATWATQFDNMRRMWAQQYVRCMAYVLRGMRKAHMACWSHKKIASHS